MKTPRWIVPLLAIALAGAFGACQNKGEYGSDQGAEENPPPAEQPAATEDQPADTVVIEHPEGMDANVKIDEDGDVSGEVDVKDHQDQ